MNLQPNSPLNRPGTVLFDASRQGDAHQRSLFFADPVDTLEVYSTSDIPDLLQELDKRVASGFYAAGFMDYEAGYAFERWPVFTKPSSPLAWFGIYDLLPVFGPSFAENAA